VASSNAALGHVLAVKQYENLTWCHSVNVAMLSLLIGRQIGLDGQLIVALVEAALLHDIGKTRVPLEVVQKPGALDRSERKLIEAHATYGGARSWPAPPDCARSPRPWRSNTTDRSSAAVILTLAPASYRIR
jgi:putative nucleotidyltransferase with HDIG domain